MDKSSYDEAVIVLVLHGLLLWLHVKCLSILKTRPCSYGN